MQPCDFKDAMARHAMDLTCPANEQVFLSWPPLAWACLERQLGALDAELRRHDSATLALERWCGTGGSASKGCVSAELVSAVDADPVPEQRWRLCIGRAEPVRCRRVRLLFCGHVLSEAENWYVPGRLTAAMRRRLDQANVPFGRVVRALRFRRLRLTGERLWEPPPAGRDTGCPDAGPPPFVLRHRALLLRADGAPFSEVTETYTRDALLLGRPGQPPP